MKENDYVGTIVGESNSREFRLAVAHETIREQDIIAVDAELRRPENDKISEKIRVWAKVQKIERLNPLFPAEAGHELAETRTDPFDTVLSMSREMVTAVCQVLGAESSNGKVSGKLDHLRYPPQPASRAYRPDSRDIARVVLGDLQENQKRALDIATLSNRPEVNVLVNGHAIVTRHLAILAMTGAGKSVTARRIIEELTIKNYPMVIFDPHGEYAGLGEVEKIKNRIRRYYAQFPVFEEPSDKVMAVVESLAWKLSDNQSSMFEDIFNAAKAFINTSDGELDERTNWLSQYLENENIAKFGVQPNLYFLADFVALLVKAGRNNDTNVFKKINDWSKYKFDISKQKANWLDGLITRLRTAAKALKRMEDISKKMSHEGAEALPKDRKSLVQYGGISIISLAGYTSDFQATIYSLIAEELFDARVRNELKLPVLLVLEESHNFAPAKANTPAEERSITITKQIAQEGRKFGVGLILISQRPSRLDETTLSQVNSYIIMRMVNPADQNYVRKVVETLGEEEAHILPDLDVGEAILSGQLISFPVLVKIKEPESKGEREERDAFEVLEEAYINIKKNKGN